MDGFNKKLLSLLLAVKNIHRPLEDFENDKFGAIAGCAEENYLESADRQLNELVKGSDDLKNLFYHYCNLLGNISESQILESIPNSHEVETNLKDFLIPPVVIPQGVPPSSSGLPRKSNEIENITFFVAKCHKPQEALRNLNFGKLEQSPGSTSHLT